MSDNPAKKSKRDVVKIDHETGLIHVPGAGDLPLRGDFTSGAGYQLLKQREAEFLEIKRWVSERLAKAWKCTQCARIIPGTKLKIKRHGQGDAGTLLEFIRAFEPVCPGYDDRGQHVICDAPVVEYVEAQ